MLELKTPREVAAMDVTGTFIAELLDDLEHRAEPGVNLLELEDRARQLIAQRGATSCYWDYSPSFGRGPFRNVICLSVNDAVLHGLPHDYVLQDGDLLTMDIAVSIDGWVADCARSIIVGNPRPEDERLIAATEKALTAGIAAAVPATGWAMCLRRSARSPQSTGTRSTPNSVVTGSGGPCTKIRTYRTQDVRAEDSHCARG